MLEITDSPDVTKWSEFVLNHPHGNIFQTPEMAEVYRRTKKPGRNMPSLQKIYEESRIAVIDKCCVALLASVMMKNKRIVKQRFINIFFYSDGNAYRLQQ